MISHSQYGSPMAMHLISRTCWFLTAEERPLRKPVVKKHDGSPVSRAKLSRFSPILIVSPRACPERSRRVILPTLQNCIESMRRLIASSPVAPASIRCSPNSFPAFAPPMRNAMLMLFRSRQLAWIMSGRSEAATPTVWLKASTKRSTAGKGSPSPRSFKRLIASAAPRSVFT